MSSESNSSELANPIVQDLRAKLAALNLNTTGTKAVLKQRLKKAQVRIEKTRKNAVIVDQPDYKYYLVFDVEATCKENNEGFVQEIIEFPVVLVDTRTLEIVSLVWLDKREWIGKVDEFRSFVKPVVNPVLTEFCVELTGIDQVGWSRFVEYLI